MTTQMTCPHRPTSNGWSGGTNAPTTYCGRCRQNVPVDVTWANTYYDKKVAQLVGDLDRERARRIEDVERDRAHLIRLIQTSGTT